jgi:cell division protein FtsL
MIETKPLNVAHKICNNCDELKIVNDFHKNRNICKNCINQKRRQKYNDNIEYRQKIIQQVTLVKHKKVIERQRLKEQQQIEIGIENKKCKYCNQIKSKILFRHNRLKCKDCERDDPIEKFKRYVRTRIYNALKRNKTQHTIYYLGCSSEKYYEWIFNYDNNYTIVNYGKEWHIDHVIPISLFNLDNEEERLLAFNWRNTMPLSSKENLTKNNNIITKQIKQHYKNLIKYHKEKNLDLPQVFIDLFAKHLDDGNPLKLSLPFTYGNICEELS